MSDLLDVLEALGVSRTFWIRQYWWLALGQSDERATRTPDVALSATLWPPFWGERVPLGGESA